MSTIPLDSISPNDPSLNTPQPDNSAADAFAPSTLQHGLTRDDATGRIIIKPDLAAEVDPKTLGRANLLLDASRQSEANSIVGCGHIQNVTSYCSHHEAEKAPVVCGKPLLHEPCAVPKARVRKFEYEHPELYDYLMHSVIHVLTFTIPHEDATPTGQRFKMVDGRAKFNRFVAALNLDAEEHGWQWLAGFSHRLQGTTFYAIHEGGSIPHWPELNALWRRIAGNTATLRLRTYDGRDGDEQAEGIRTANSGFVELWYAVADGLADPLAISLAFRGEDLTTLSGKFRGFATPAEETPEREMPICATCGSRHVPGHGRILLTNKELAERFDHIRPPTYGQRRMRRYGHAPDAATFPSPPPW